MEDNREDLVKDYWNLYCEFFYIENQLALIEGRNYRVIYSFYLNMCNMYTKEVDISKFTDSMTELNIIIENFKDITKLKYPFIDTNVKYSINANNDDIRNIFNEKCLYDFEKFYTSYCNISNYKKSVIVDKSMIEFNNFLSHFIYFVDNNILSSGVSHLFRGTLDAYKQIILENNILLLSDTDLRDEFIKLRIDESINIGKQNKKDIIKKYNNITNSILTLLNY